MSDIADDGAVAVSAQPAPAAENKNRPKVSLKDRIRAQAEENARNRADWFELPGFPFVAVKLRPLGIPEVTIIAESNERIKPAGRQNTYNAADQIAMATLGFVDVDDFPELTPEVEPQDGLDWVTLAQHKNDKLGNVDTRTAIIDLLGSDRLLQLLEQYDAWSKGQRGKVVEETSRGFTANP